MTMTLNPESQPQMIGIPGSYFKKMAQADYQNYRSALAREFLQNSNDAGATQVEFVLDKNAQTLTVTDDGCGMDRETLVDKLLTLGGSQKPEGSVGGFGKAKELLFFSWESYEIHTRNHIVRGSGAHYTIEQTDAWTDGTRCVLQFAPDENLYDLEFWMKHQLQLNQTACRIIWNGEVLDFLRKGKLIRTAEQDGKPFAEIHVVKSRMDDKVYIRLRGVTMFTKWSSSKLKGQIVIELLGESVDLLTSNRDGMNWRAERALDSLIQEILMDCNSSLREKAPKVERYEGEGLLSTLGTISKEVEALRKSIETTQQHVELATSAKELVEIVQGDHRLKHYFHTNIDRLAGLEASEARVQIQAALKALKYKPDFIVKRRDKLPKALDPKSWTNANLKLALMWESVVKRVLLDTGKEVEFAVGWVTDDADTLAELYPIEGGGHAFLLNPENPAFKTRNFGYIVGELVDLAVHETTHLDHKFHNEAFVNTCESHRRRCRTTDFGGIIREAIRSL